MTMKNCDYLPLLDSGLHDIAWVRALDPLALFDALPIPTTAIDFVRYRKRALPSAAEDTFAIRHGENSVDLKEQRSLTSHTI